MKIVRCIVYGSQFIGELADTVSWANRRRLVPISSTARGMRARPDRLVESLRGDVTGTVCFVAMERKDLGLGVEIAATCAEALLGVSDGSATDSEALGRFESVQRFSAAIFGDRAHHVAAGRGLAIPMIREVQQWQGKAQVLDLCQLDTGVVLRRSALETIRPGIKAEQRTVVWEEPLIAAVG